MDSGAIVGIGAALMVLVVVLPLALTHGTNNVCEMEDAWRKLAGRHHLSYKSGSRSKAHGISGELGGRAVLIKRESGKEPSPTRVQVTLHGPLPDGLHIGPHQSKVEVFGHVLVAGGIDTGDSVFDREVSVKGDDPESIRAYLTEARERAAAQVVELGGELEDSVLTVPLERKDAGLEDLDRVVHALQETAAVLDAATTASGRSGASLPASGRAAAPR